MVSPSREPIAVVRTASLFPGALTVQRFWDNIRQGHCAIRDVPDGRWPVPVEDFFDTTPQPDRAYARCGGFVEGFAFDPSGLKLDPALARDLDPLFQWPLHVGRELVAGVDLPRDRTGVFLANLILPTDAFVKLGRSAWRTVLRASLGPAADALPVTESRPHILNHFSAGLPAGLLARALDLRGGTLALDAACASSLYAIKLAVDQLQSGRADAMIAGGVARVDHLTLALGFSQLRAISKTGRSRPFDAAADGLVPGEGCGLLLLRRLSDAQARGEEILAVIRGIGLSNDGRGRGTLMPSTEGQVRSLHAAYQEAGLEPTSVGLVECHATGTPVGDATEVQTLRTVWGPHAPVGGTAIGSVKSMIGHLLAAAGSAGTIKAIQALRHAELPPTINFEKPSAGTELRGAPVYLNTQLRKWEQRSGPRRAAVSAFGFGGCNAHLILEEAPARAVSVTARPVPRERLGDEPLAVVAMNARVGDLDLQAYRRLIFEGRSALGPVPAGRWMGLEQGGPAAPVAPVAGTFIGSLDVDDPLKLRIPPLEMERMLSQQLLALLVAEQAFSDGKVLGRMRDRGRVGVVFGMAMEADAGNYAFRWSMIHDILHARDRARADWLQQVTDEATVKCTAESVLGFLANLIANRISSRFDLGGPSLSVAAEDAGGLKALETAALMLRRGDVDAMLVGAVDLPGDIRSVWAADEIQGFSRTEVRPFDKRADGSAPGEGAAVVFLKRLADAQRDGDPVLAVVRGIGAAHDGAEGAVGVPTRRGHAEALRRAYDDAGVPTKSVGLVVAHASGRPAEDQAEMTALHDVFGVAHDEAHAALHAVKAVVGHLGAASGLVSLVDAVLALEGGAIPPTRGLDDPAMPELWKGSPFYAARKARPWLGDVAKEPRRAAVSTLSLDGNHVHVVLEQGTYHATTTVLGPAPEALFIFRGASRDDVAGQLRAFRPSVAGADLERLALQRAAAHRRGKAAFTVALVASDTKDLQAKIDKALAALASGVPLMMDIHGVFFSSRPLADGGRIAFVFPGAGNAYAGMAREVVLRFPEQLWLFEDKTRVPRTCTMERWVHPREIFKSRPRRDEVRSANEMLWATGYYTQMLSDALRYRMGIRPDVALGYSLGESSGLFALDAWDAVDELYTRLTTWPLITTEIAGPMNAVLRAWQKRGVDVESLRGTNFWATWLLVCPPEQVAPFLEDEPLVHFAIINAPNECVIAGHAEACKRIIEKAKCSAHYTPFPVAVHVPEVTETEQEYRLLHTLPTHVPRGVQYYSSGTGEPYAMTADAAAESIVAQAISCVDFPRLIRNAYRDGVRMFVEVGPRGSCTRWIEKILEGRDFLAVASDRKGRSEFVNLLHVAAHLAGQGVDIDLERLYSAQPDLPAHAVPPTRRRYPTAHALSLPPPAASPPAASPPVASPPVASPTVASPPVASPTVASPPVASPTVASPLVGEAGHAEHGRVGGGASRAAPASSRSSRRRAVPPPRPPPVSHLSKPVLSPIPVISTRARPVAPPPPSLRVPVRPLHPSVPPPAGGPIEVPASVTMPLPPAPEVPRAVSMPPPPPDPVPPLQEGLVPATAAVPPASFAYAPDDAVGQLVAGFSQTYASMMETHRAFLESTRVANEALARVLALSVDGAVAGNGVNGHAALPAEKPAVFTREQIIEHGVGTPSRLWGPEYAVFDSGRRMARLPNGPYRLLDRVTEVGQPPRQLTVGAWLVGEYDVPAQAWYFESNQYPTMPFGIALEVFLQPCGFLASYMGADLRCALDRRFRNLGGRAVLHREILPGCGTLSTRATLSRFSEYGDMLVVDFDVVTSLNGTPVMEGTSYFGFFTDAALAAQKGLTGKTPPFLAVTAPAPEDVHTVPGLAHPPLIMLDRLVALDPTGGRHGRGYARAEKDVNPAEWFFQAHFHQDPVTPGSLGVEGLLQLMQRYMQRVLGVGPGYRFEPVLLGHPWEWTYRGQVIGRNQRVSMELEVLDAQGGESPVLRADCFLSVDGLGIYRLDNVGMRAVRRAG